MANMLRVIHLGPDAVGTACQRAWAFQDLGHEVKQLYYRWPGRRMGFPQRLYNSLRRKAGVPAELCGENASLIQLTASFQPHVVFLDKALTVRPSTLRLIARNQCPPVVIAYSPDDNRLAGNHSRYYLNSMALLDLVVTTKADNVAYLRRHGAVLVLLVENAYSRRVHRPVEVSARERLAYGARVSFVGGYERDRAEQLRFMAQSGIQVRVWGNNWHRFSGREKNLIIEKRPAYGDDYAKVVCCSDISLGFLRKVSRDTVTTRTMELPACGGFMLMERTREQQALFEEGVEAEYFSDSKELLRKTHFYLENDERRKQVAAAGFKRCQTSPYSYEDRMLQILEVCRQQRKRGDCGF